MKRPQIKFHAHTMSDSQVIRSKKSKFIIRSNLKHRFLSSSMFYWNYNKRCWYAFASL